MPVARANGYCASPMPKPESLCINRGRLYPAVLAGLLWSSGANAQGLSYALAGGNGAWPSWARDAVTASMDEAVALYNRNGHFDKHLTANYSPGVPTAQANYSGWIDFGGSYNTRVALHEIAHALGTGTYWPFDGGAWSEDSAAGRLVKLYEGQGALLNTGGTHFWPYGLNYDNEDGAAARMRQVRLVSAFRFDMGIVKDSDGDGLPDDWETFHFSGLTQSGQDDPDGDGIDNAREYATDSNPTLAAPVVDGRTYVVRCQITHLALTVIGDSQDEFAGTEQRAYADSSSQHWLASYLGDGFFSLTNVGSGKVLEVPGADTASGLPIRQADWTGAFKQQWRFAEGPGAEQGYFQVANRETARVIDGLDGADGAAVKQYPFIGDIPQQFWSFEELAATTRDGDAGPDNGGASGTEPMAGGDTEDGAPFDESDAAVPENEPGQSGTAETNGSAGPGAGDTSSSQRSTADLPGADPDADGCRSASRTRPHSAGLWLVIFGLLLAWRRRGLRAN